MEKFLIGDIFYDHVNNLYVIITGAVFTDELRYICMEFDGYETDHSYLKNSIYTKAELEDESIYLKMNT